MLKGKKVMLEKLLDAEQKVATHKTVKKIIDLFANPKGFFAVIALIALVYSYKAADHPGLHGDELSLLAIPYRAVEFNDYNYPLIFSESYNAGPVRHYPPIMAMMLRTFWHKAVGFSDYSSRLFSGLMMGTLAALFGWLMLRRTKNNWKLAVASLMCIGLNPALVVAARTVRFEQEIVFMGGVAFLLPFLLMRGAGPWISRLVWTISGLCAAWAGFSHPWGMVFPFVLVMSFLFMSKEWKAEDGLGFVGRIFFFGIGCVLPFVATLLQVTHDWPRFLDYMRDIGEFYEMRHDKLVGIFLNRFNLTFLGTGILGRVIASILQLHVTGFGATATELGGIDILPIGIFFQIIFWGFVASLFMCKRNKDKPFHVRLWVYLAAAFVIFGLLYVPNQVYVLYAGLFVVVAALLLRSSGDCRYLAAGVRGYTALCVLFASSYLVFLTLSPQVAASVPLDERYSAFKEMNEAVGLKEGVVFTDSGTWYAGGKDTKAYADIMRTGKIIPSAAFVVDAGIFNGHVQGIGKYFLPQQEAGKTWQDQLGREMSQKVMRSMIFVEPSTGYYYLMPTNVENPILITLYDKKGEKRQFRGSYNDMVPMRPDLAPRWYLLMTPPAVPADFGFLKKEKNVTVHYAQQGDRIASAALIEVHDHTTLETADPKIIMVPLLFGWKTGE